MLQVNKLIFEDEITLYWDKEWDLPDSISYEIKVNTKTIQSTNKTYCYLCDLTPNTSYEIVILQRISGKETIVFSETITTKPHSKLIDVTQAPYFANGDGKTLNTNALQQAINDCKAGETVYFPKGTYVTGALDLHSDMQVYLEADAMLLGSTSEKDYLPKIKSRFEGTECMCYRSLLNLGSLDHTAGYNCKNVFIRGKGTIYGGGKSLATDIMETERTRLKEYLEKNADYVKTCENENTIPGRVRGRLINMSNCENIVLSGLKLGFGAAWNIHFIYSKNIFTYNCTIQSNTLYKEDDSVFMENVWNGDGWDPDSSENCVLFDSVLDTYDDGVAIKSGKNPEGNIINRPTKDVRIFDCRGSHGVAIGSELSGGIENVYIWDCDLLDDNNASGFRIKTSKKRGGYVRNVKVKNCRFGDIRIWSGYRCNDDGETSGILTVTENLSFDTLILRGGLHYEKYDHSIWRFNPIMIVGFEELPIKNVRFKNLKFLPFKEENKLVTYELNNDSPFAKGYYKDVPIFTLTDDEVQHIHIKNVENLSFENISFINKEN